MQEVRGRTEKPKRRHAVTDNYPAVTVNGKTRRVHALRAEAALGKPLPAGAEVHHADGSKNADAPLVICQDRRYHMLLHRRTRVYRAGGNPDTDAMCSLCRLPRPLSEFYIRRKGRGANSPTSVCYPCHVTAQRERLRARRPRLAYLPVHCHLCGGHGQVAVYSHGDFEGPDECALCAGSGQLYVSPKDRLWRYPGAIAGRAEGLYAVLQKKGVQPIFFDGEKPATLEHDGDRLCATCHAERVNA